MKGRKPKPTALKKLKGEKRPSRINALEPQPRKGIPKKPLYLNELEKKIWDYLSDVLNDMRVLTEADLFTLMNLCGIVEQIILLKKDVDKEGNIQRTQKVDALGNEIIETKSNPKANQLHKLYAEYRYYSGLFGLDPSSRVRLKTGEHLPEDPLEKFLGKK